MSKKQTAVEWLVYELKNELGYGVDLGKSDQRVLDKIIEQVNKIFEHQIIDAFEKGKLDGWNLTSAEQYYNETFNQTT